MNTKLAAQVSLRWGKGDSEGWDRPTERGRERDGEGKRHTEMEEGLEI